MEHMDASQRIIVALDAEVGQARELAGALAGKASWLKVGMTLYYNEGPRIVAELKESGFQVFVDLKLHDIPHQVRGAASAVARAGADMLTVHASGGLAMMQAACEGAEAGYRESVYSNKGFREGACSAGFTCGNARPLCLAITVLTSLDSKALESMGVPDGAEGQVRRMARLAKEARMDGIVCSPGEAAMIRRESGGDLAIVTPGIRPANSDARDQARIATPAMALEAGADYLVIGRPITEAADPRLAFENIVEEMKYS